MESVDGQRKNASPISLRILEDAEGHEKCPVRVPTANIYICVCVCVSVFFLRGGIHEMVGFPVGFPVKPSTRG